MTARHTVFLVLTTLGAGAAGAPPCDSGEVMLYNKCFREAAAYYFAAVKRQPNSLALHRRYQDACGGLSDSAQLAMRAYYRGLLDNKTNSSSLNYLYGRCLPCSSGVAYFDKALACSSRFAWALNAKGACCFETGNLSEAKDLFLRAIQCDLDFAGAYRNLAQVNRRAGQEGKVQKVVRGLIARNRKSPAAYEWLGDLYLEQHKNRYAIMGYQRSIALGACGPGVYFKLGYACFEEKRFAEAAANYGRSITEGNVTSAVYYNLGATQEQLQHPEEAMHNYQIAYDKTGDDSILYSLGNCAVMLGLYTKAIDVYGRFLQKHQSSTEALFGLANAYQMKKDFPRAIELYQRVLSIDARFAKACYNLGSIYAYHLNDSRTMSLYWNKFIELHPGSAEARFLRTEMQKLCAPH